jgi:hypothetical protein
VVTGQRCDRCKGWHVLGGTTAPVSRQARRSAEDEATRLAVFERDGWCCVCCGQSVIGRPHSAGHRQRASQGGPYTPTNLITLLGFGTGLTADDHHRRIDTRRRPEDELRGLTVRSTSDPALIPVQIVTPAGALRKVWLTPDSKYADHPPKEGVAA